MSNCVTYEVLGGRMQDVIGETASSSTSVLQQIEKRSIDWVPPKERHGTVREQFFLWFLGNFQIFSIATGFVGVSLGLSLLWSIVAGTLGILIGTLFMAFHATQGPVFGLPQMIQSRAQFGYRGVVVALIGSFFTFMAFNVVDQILLSLGFEGAYGWNAAVMAVVVTVLATLLAIFGHDWVHKVFRWLLYITAPLIVIVTIAVLFGKAGGAAPKDPGGFTWVAFMGQLSVAAAYNISYAPYVSDYSRYLPRETRSKPIIGAVFFGAAGSAIWLIALGAWMASRLGATDGLVGLQTAGNAVTNHLGGIAAFLTAAALIATMGMNAYGAMLTVVTAVDSFTPVQPTRRWRVVTLLVLAVVWYVVAKAISVDSVGAVFSALTLMLYLLVPWTAINLVDYFFVRRGRYAIMDLVRPGGVYGMWSLPGLAAFLIGFLAELPFMVILPIGKFQYTGWIAGHLLEKTDLAWIVGLIVSGVAFLLLSKSRNAQAEDAAVAASDRELGQLANH